MRQLLRRPDFRLLLVALTVSMVAESVLILALGIWVKDLTGSDGLAGATFVALTAPMVLAPLVGWVVDRAPRRSLFVVLNVVTAVLLAPLLTVTDGGRLWIVYAVAAGYGLSYIALGATVTALVQELVPTELLPDANGAVQTVKQGLRLAGPLLGAGLYVLLGGSLLAAACALGFLTAGGVGLLLRTAQATGTPDPVDASPTDPPHVPSAGPVPADAGGDRAGGVLGAGVRHLAGEPALRRVLIAAVVATVALGLGETLWFAYVDSGLGREPAFLGVLVSLQGVGGLLGGVASAALVRRFGELTTVAFGVVAFAAGSVALTRPALGLAVASSLLIGAGLPVAMVGTMTLVQRRTPAHLTGRVSASLDALVSGPQAVAIGVGAVLVGLVDYRVLYGVIGALLAAVAGYLVAGRRLTAPDPGQPASGSGPEDRTEPSRADPERTGSPPVGGAPTTTAVPRLPTGATAE
ncbi:MFS transporter [Micromonospora sp. DT47]|uniref:MFS transporter n=1 Tax=Micromonospora sp. DT47 TaxID=3393431 RepID=UPI003CE8427A